MGAVILVGGVLFGGLVLLVVFPPHGARRWRRVTRRMRKRVRPGHYR